MIYLDDNGVTVIADRKAKIGEYYSLGDKQYLVVDNSTLWDMVRLFARVSIDSLTKTQNLTRFEFSFRV
tara:strand:+ start:326 stop:532 length:207 start_codon:yes stop_codon:yes gene_type:complete